MLLGDCKNISLYGEKNIVSVISEFLCAEFTTEIWKWVISDHWIKKNMDNNPSFYSGRSFD